MVLKYLLLAVLLAGASWAQTEPSVKNVLESLPPELQGKVDEGQVTALQNKSAELFKEKCQKNGGPDAFTNVQNSFKEFTKCLSNIVNVTQVKQEVEDAKPNGQVDEVFKKYCAKTPELKGCFKDATESVKPCLLTEERANLKTVYNISEQLVEFVCFKEGDRIALFIAEGGPECFQEKTEQIQQCVNSTVGDDYNLNGIDTSNVSIENIPKIEFGPSECSKVRKLQACVVEALEGCAAPTTANIVDSLFKYAVDATPCKKLEEQKKNSAGAALTSVALVAFAALLAL